MGELSDARRDLLESVAEEFLHNSWAGRRLLAVESATDEDAARFADDLAAVLAERGQRAVRRSVGDVDEATLRGDTVEPFRAGELAGAEDPETTPPDDTEPSAELLSKVRCVSGASRTRARLASWNSCSQAIQSCQTGLRGLPNTCSNWRA